MITKLKIRIIDCWLFNDFVIATNVLIVSYAVNDFP